MFPRFMNHVALLRLGIVDRAKPVHRDGRFISHHPGIVAGWRARNIPPPQIELGAVGMGKLTTASTNRRNFGLCRTSLASFLLRVQHGLRTSSRMLLWHHPSFHGTCPSYGFSCWISSISPSFSSALYLVPLE